MFFRCILLLLFGMLLLLAAAAPGGFALVIFAGLGLLLLLNIGFVLGDLLALQKREAEKTEKWRELQSQLPDQMRPVNATRAAQAAPDDRPRGRRSRTPASMRSSTKPSPRRVRPALTRVRKACRANLGPERI